jgi:hypothetical protein
MAMSTAFLLPLPGERRVQRACFRVATDAFDGFGARRWRGALARPIPEGDWTCRA